MFWKSRLADNFIQLSTSSEPVRLCDTQSGNGQTSTGEENWKSPVRKTRKSHHQEIWSHQVKHCWWKRKIESQRLKKYGKEVEGQRRRKRPKIKKLSRSSVLLHWNGFTERCTLDRNAFNWRKSARPIIDSIQQCGIQSMDLCVMEHRAAHLTVQ